MKNSNQFFSLILIFILTLSEGIHKVETLKLSSKVSLSTTGSTSWNFGDMDFRNLGTITRALNVNNLRFHAKSDKSMQIKSSQVNVGGTNFYYSLSLGGTGEPVARSVSFETSGTSTIKVTARSTGANRNLIIADIYKKKLGQITFGSNAELKSTTINFSGTVFLYSENSNIDLYKIQVDTSGNSSSTSSSSSSSSSTPKSSGTTVAGGVATITRNSESDLLAAIKKVNSNGGTVYINTPVISISTTSTINLSGSKSGGIVGVKQSDGTYPRLDFSNARNKGSTARGITISGSNQYLKYLIIEHAGDNGIWISGSKNTLDHIITRYNNDTGIQLSDHADANTLNYCYSYRNIDVKTYGANADGFAPKLGATNTVFNYCFAWDNSDDGWDSFDKQGDNSATVTYKHSACWNNGNPDIFTGKYDYDNGAALDKNLWTVQQLIASDSSFESNYKNRKFSIAKGKIAGQSATSWLSKAQTEMNGNGFKFGSKTTAQSTSVKRTADYCVAFDHKAKGFDNNNSQGCTGYITNCVSFNNNINYQLPYVFAKWSNNWSFNAYKSDQNKMNQSLKKPRNASSSKNAFYSVRNNIIKYCYANKFPDGINFDNAINSMS